MGQKAHPKGLRLKIIHDFDSTWIADDPRSYAKNVKEDYIIRDYLNKKLKGASLSRVEIHRKAQRVIVLIITGRPGMVVGRGGQELDKLRKNLQALTSRKDIQIDVLEVNKIEADATLVAQSVAQQLEKRVAYRRIIKQTIQRSMRAGIKGLKIKISGRLGGAEIARTEWAKEARVPCQTLRADIDYGVAEALTVFGIIGVKIWIFKGEVLPGQESDPNIKFKTHNANANTQAARAEQGAGIQGAGARRARSARATGASATSSGASAKRSPDASSDHAKQQSAINPVVQQENSQE